jgi:hypothetical protein
VKGLPDPIEIFELAGAGQARTRLQAAALRGLTRFVGRDSEVEHLRRVLGQAGADRGQVVAIVGVAGVASRGSPTSTPGAERLTTATCGWTRSPSRVPGELLDALLGDDPGLAPLKQLLDKRGNPFFMEESVRTLVETKALAGERAVIGSFNRCRRSRFRPQCTPSWPPASIASPRMTSACCRSPRSSARTCPRCCFGPRAPPRAACPDRGRHRGAPWRSSRRKTRP